MDAQRRALMFGAAATAALGLPVHSQAASPSLDDFIQLSARLCGQTAAALNRDMAQRILQILVSHGKAADLQALLQDDAALPALATELRAIWFTGLADTSSGTVVVGFPDALTWRSASFLHVPGSCGGATGYWAEAPASQGA